MQRTLRYITVAATTHGACQYTAARRLSPTRLCTRDSPPASTGSRLQRRGSRAARGPGAGPTRRSTRTSRSVPGRVSRCLHARLGRARGGAEGAHVDGGDGHGAVQPRTEPGAGHVRLLCSRGPAWSPGPPLPSMHGLRRCPATPRPCMLAPHAPGPRLPSPPRHTAPPLYLVCAGRQVADVACMIPGGCSRGGGT